jgi:hypothetical protein
MTIYMREKALNVLLPAAAATLRMALEAATESPSLNILHPSQKVNGDTLYLFKKGGRRRRKRGRERDLDNCSSISLTLAR